MQSALDRKLLVVTGKGGAGKTTTAAALGLLAAARGRRTIVVEVGEQSRLPELFGIVAPRPGVETQLQERLSSISIDPDRALLEWLQVLGGSRAGPRARLERHLSVLRRCGARSKGARHDGQGLAADPRCPSTGSCGGL